MCVRWSVYKKTQTNTRRHRLHNTPMLRRWQARMKHSQAAEGIDAAAWDICGIRRLTLPFSIYGCILPAWDAVRGRGTGSIDPTRPQEGSELMWFGSTYRKWVPPRGFFHISWWNCHKVPAWSKKHRLEHFFFFFLLRMEILHFKILKVLGCQLFYVLHGCLTYPDTEICPHLEKGIYISLFSLFYIYILGD